MNALETLFRTVLDLSWRASWPILVLFILRWLARDRIPARMVFAGWIAVTLRLLLPISFPAAWSPFRAHATSGSLSGAAETRDQRQGPTFALADSAAPSVAVMAGQNRQDRESFVATDWAARIWLSGVSLLLAARGCARLRFGHRLRRSRWRAEAAAGAWPPMIADEVRARGLRILVTDVVSAPALHGIFFPRLLFPRRFIEELSSIDLQFIVRHELAHHARRDLAADALIGSAVILHWFNPFVWVMARLARHDCELACDEAVVGRLGAADRETYGATLLRTLRLANFNAKTPLGIGVVASKQQMKRRIRMILAPIVAPLGAALVAGAVFSTVVAMSLTSEIHAQSPDESISPRPATAGPRTSPAVTAKPNIVYNASVDGLDTLFPSGVVATIGERTITVADLRSEIEPLIPQLSRETNNQAEFKMRLDRLQNSVVTNLVSRILLIKEFGSADESNRKHIATDMVDKTIQETVQGQFGGDRSKFLANLRDRGLTMKAYRQLIEEDIIYSYMKSQERKMDQASKPIKTAAPNQAHLRMIQLARGDAPTDAALLEKAEGILTRFRNGDRFDALAREYSVDARAAKGGDWGWVAPSDLKPAYSQTVFALKKGEVSAPLVSKEGVFLFYIEDRR